LNATVPARKTNPVGDRILAGCWIVLVVALLGAVAMSAWMLLLPLLMGYLLATLLIPVIERLDRRGIPRAVSAGGVLGVLTAAAGLLVVLATPVVVAQIQFFQSHSREYLEIASSRLTGLVDFLSRLVPHRELELAKQMALSRLSSHGSPFGSLQELFDILPLLENALLTLVVAFFLLAKGAEIRSAFVGLIPNRYFEMSLRLLYRVQRQTADYLRGQSLDSLANGILVGIVLTILQVPYAMFIGVFAGLANAVPLLGPIAGGIPAIALALLGATATPWWVIAAALFVIHMIDNMVIYPATVGGSLHLPPWVVILGIAIGSHTGGIVGMLVAVPMIGLLRGFVIELHASLKGFRIL
jgi:putative permease